LTAKQGRYNL